jgi:hypothetical protein
MPTVLLTEVELCQPFSNLMDRRLSYKYTPHCQSFTTNLSQRNHINQVRHGHHDLLTVLEILPLKPDAVENPAQICSLDVFSFTADLHEQTAQEQYWGLL